MHNAHLIQQKILKNKKTSLLQPVFLKYFFVVLTADEVDARAVAVGDSGWNGGGIQRIAKAQKHKSPPVRAGSRVLCFCESDRA